MKMLKQLKGKLVFVEWQGSYPITQYRLEDYDSATDTTWIKLRSLYEPKKMTWFRFSDVNSIGRVP